MIINPFIVLPELAPVIAPLADKVVIPLRAPALLTFKPGETRVNVPVPFPMDVESEPVEFTLVVPVMVAPFATVKPLLIVADPDVVKFPFASKLATVVPLLTFKTSKSPPEPGVAPPLITAIGVVALDTP